MNKVVEILMRRDELTEDEAMDLVEETRDAIIGDPDCAEEIIEDYLGLEMDYIFDILEFERK